jgi:excinuclease ABC subunit C
MGFEFGVRVGFEAARAEEILLGVPAGPGVFALRGEAAEAEPYLTRTMDLRRRMRRLLDPPESQSKRLNLRDRVRWIEYTGTGSEFESMLALYDATSALFGVELARKRLRLFPPYFLRLTMGTAHPRVYSTNRLSRRGLGTTYGPFPSRAAAERYCDAVLDLFKLRRCHEDLEVSATHPGCAYGEMKKCMAPCNLGCSAEEYGAEAAAVEAFFRTRGESMLAGIGAARERASEEMEFERAAALHEEYSRVKAAAALADELVRPVEELAAVVVQEAGKSWGGTKRVEVREEDGRAVGSIPLTGSLPDAPGPHPFHEAGKDGAQEAAVFMLRGGCVAGPVRLSTLGVRAVKEQTSVGSSLFAQPLMLQAVPLAATDAVTAVESPEVRAERVLAELESRLGGAADLARMGDHLALFRRWYYRPEKQRKGECFLPNADGGWPLRRILRGAARMAIGEPKGMAETDREGAAEARTKILHEGREGVERVVAVVGGRRKKKTSGEGAEVAPRDAETAEEKQIPSE